MSKSNSKIVLKGYCISYINNQNTYHKIENSWFLLLIYFNLIWCVYKWNDESLSNDCSEWFDWWPEQIEQKTVVEIVLL